MKTSSHRLRIEEKKAYRKLFSTVVFFILFILLVIFAGIPLLTKTIVFLSSFRKENPSANTDISSIINPPVLDSIAEATNSSVISVSGRADKESTVKILLNDTEVAKVMADKDSRFKTQNFKLQEGTNSIVGYTMKDNQDSSPSGTLTIIYLKKPPKLDITSPSEGQKFIAESKDIFISGETDPGNKVIIKDRFIIVNQDGKFNYKVTLSDGDNTFKIVATDIAGNQTIVERKVNYRP